MNVVRLLGLLSLAIFGGEIAIMFALNRIPIESELLKNVVDAAILIVIIFPFLYFFAFKTTWAAQQRLERQVAERTAVIAKTNTVLEASVARLRARQREMAVLGETGNLLQACNDLNEATRVAETQLRQLFPSLAGGLFLLKPSHNVLEKVAAWGDGGIGQLHAPEDCWALRRGKPHLVKAAEHSMACHHLRCIDVPWHICLPLTAQGEALGTISLFPTASQTEREEIDPAQMDFYTAAAETLALAVANLRLREKLRHQALRDPVTGLFNRRYVLETLTREIDRAASRGQPLSVAMIDIDHFKRFNDSFGHPAGDTVLSRLGSAMCERMHKEDIVARYGGEEFVIVLPGTAADEAFGRLDSLRRDIETLSVKHAGQPLARISISVGIATCPAHGTTPEALLRFADEALYESKRAGRNRVTVASLSAGLMRMIESAQPVSQAAECA